MEGKLKYNNNSFGKLKQRHSKVQSLFTVEVAKRKKYKVMSLSTFQINKSFRELWRIIALFTEYLSLEKAAIMLAKFITLMHRGKDNSKMWILAIRMKEPGRKAYLMGMEDKVIVMEIAFKVRWCMELSLVMEPMHSLMATYIKDLFTITKAMDMAN